MAIQMLLPPAVTGTPSAYRIKINGASISGSDSVLYYAYQQSANGSPNWSQSGNISLVDVMNGRTFPLTLQDNAKYKFRSRAWSELGHAWVNSPETSSFYYTTPTAPSGLRALALDTSVSIFWDVNAFEASNIVLQRATNSAFSAGLTTIYDGNPKSSHNDTLPNASVIYYYRIRATTPAGTTAWSNTATLVYTQAPPNKVTSLARVAPVDSNTVTVTWSAITTGSRPITGIEFGYRWLDTPSATWNTVNLSSSTRSYTIPGATNKRVEVRVLTKNNAGNQGYATLGPLSTKPRNPSVTGYTVNKSQVTVFVTVPGYNPPSTVTLRSTLTYALSSNGTTWGSETTLATINGMVTGAQYSVKFGTNTYVRFSIQSVATVEGGTTRTSSKTDTGNFIQVGFAPLAPTGLTYTDSAVTLTIPADDIGTSTGRMVKLTSTMLDGTVQQLGSWTRNGAAATLTVASSTIVKNAARFTLNATIANTFSATIASRSLVVDLDRNQFLIGSRRHLAYIIESGSTTAKPVSVRVI